MLFPLFKSLFLLGFLSACAESADDDGQPSHQNIPILSDDAMQSADASRTDTLGRQVAVVNPRVRIDLDMPYGEDAKAKGTDKISEADCAGEAAPHQPCSQLSTTEGR